MNSEPKRKQNAAHQKQTKEKQKKNSVVDGSAQKLQELETLRKLERNLDYKLRAQESRRRKKQNK